MPTPLDQILSLYEETNSPRTFTDDLAAHLHHGIVINTPEVLILARPVPSHAPVEHINNPDHAFPAETCDTWYIYAHAGNLRTALNYFPHPLPYLAFERANQNGLRFLPLARFQKKCHGLLPRNPPPFVQH
ncbi:hypothetical protein BH09VER1_BH09VER1_45620 [soil metagenome]